MDEQQKALRKFAKLAKGHFDKTVQENIESIKEQNIKRNFERYGCPNCAAARCYRSCPRYLTNCEPEELFRWWGKTSPPDGRVREALQHIPAPPAKKGGGSKTKRKNKKKFEKDAKWVI